MSDSETSPNSLFLHALDCHRSGRLAEAETLYRAVLAIAPSHADCHHMLGVAQLQQGDYSQAADLIANAIALNGGVADYYSNLGAVRHRQGRPDLAVSCYQKALSLAPGDADVCLNLGNSLQSLREWTQALVFYERAIALQPRYPAALYNMAVVLTHRGNIVQAIDCYRRAIDFYPAHTTALCNLGLLLLGAGRLSEADRCYRRGLALDPGFAESWSNRGLVLLDLGRTDAAAVCFDRALAVRPDYPDARSNRLMTAHYAENRTGMDILEMARRLFDGPAKNPQRHFTNPADPEKRLRIGYVSGDLGYHPVGYFLANVLPFHDPDRVDLHFYSNRQIDDEMTARLLNAGGTWRRIAGVADSDVERMILEDAIDILVDLSGHTARNRLGLFARRPAPVQVSWIGYFGTTGIPAMDYVLADSIVVPPGRQREFTEKVWRLPGCYLCYAPHRLNIPVAPPPVLRNGFVTFGSFNNRAKLTTATLDLWARLLREIPQSRLFLKTRSLADPANCEDILTFFRAKGLPSDRLILEGFSPLADALKAYERVDIALDPFPFGGGATTAEVLWMGVPLVTLQGDRWAGRMSASILTAVGTRDMITQTPESYLCRAKSLAADPEELARRRHDQRRTFERSAFCDGRTFTRRLEEAFREMWRNWCRTH